MENDERYRKFVKPSDEFDTNELLLKGKLYFHRFVCIIVAPTGSETRVLDMGKAFGTLMSDQVSDT